MGGSRQARAGADAARARHPVIRQEIVGTIGRLSSGLPDSGLLGAGITLGNSGGIPRAERAQDSSVVHASSPSRRWRGRAVRRLVAFCPTSGPRNTGRSSGFRLLGCRASTDYPRVISPSPVMQVFAAHAAIARERRKHSHGKCREFPPNLTGEPRPRAARPAVPQATRPRPSIGWLADPPEGWTTSMTLPLATKRMG